MRLGIIPEQGGSIANLRRVGQDTRFIEQYLRRYVREFEEVHYFSYARETLDAPVNDNFALHANPGMHRWLYSCAMPLVHARAFRRCSVLRVMQATGAIPARIARSLYGTPFVVTYGYHYGKNYAADARRATQRIRAWLFDRRASWALRHADGVIVTTPALADFVRGVAPAANVMLIPNSVDTDRFSPAKETANNPAAARRLITVGALSPIKNHRLILEAVALMGRKDLEVVIVGTGPEEQALRRLAEEKGVALELAGSVPNDVLPERLRRSDLYLIPSLSEGHPKSLLEAMSVGLPCVGTDEKGIRDVLVHGKTGWLCPLDARVLAATVDEVLSNQDVARVVGGNAREFILANYDARVVMAREIAFLKDVAHRRGWKAA